MVEIKICSTRDMELLDMGFAVLCFSAADHGRLVLPGVPRQHLSREPAHEPPLRFSLAVGLITRTQANHSSLKELRPVVNPAVYVILPIGAQPVMFRRRDRSRCAVNDSLPLDVHA